MNIDSKDIFQFEAMSTLCEIKIFNNKTKAQNVALAILKEVKRIEKKYSFYNPDSILSKINKRELKKLDSETIWLLNTAKEFYHKTEKVFDITASTLKEAYHKTTIKEFEKRKEELLKFVGCEHFEIKKDKIIFTNPYTKIDLGGFAKEYAVDRAVRICKQHKIDSAIINFGGDIYILSKKPFKIGIKDPLSPDKFKKFVNLSNCAITTSAHYERGFKIENKNFSHIISTSLSLAKSVSVIAPTTLEAGVYSTSLLIKPCINIQHKNIIIY